MRTVALDEYKSGQVGADGTCTVALGPVAGQVWQVGNIAVSSTSVAPSEARIYSGPVGPQSYLGGTYDGNNDNAPSSVVLVRGRLVTAVWTGATPGASCTVSVYGTMQVPG